MTPQSDLPKDGRTLPWTFLRRTIRPYALAELDAAIRDAEV